MKKLFGAALIFVVSAISASACSVDAIQNSGGSRGPAGSIGSGCQCPDSQSDCDASNGGCQAGLICAKGDVSSSEQVCTQPCPCPVNFVCKAFGHLGGRLLCSPNGNESPGG